MGMKGDRASVSYWPQVGSRQRGMWAMGLKVLGSRGGKEVNVLNGAKELGCLSHDPQLAQGKEINRPIILGSRAREEFMRSMGPKS